MHTGIEHLLVPLWNAWVLRGGKPEARSINNGEGWLLTLSGRMKLASWIFLPLFAAGLAGVLILQAVDPQPPRQFWFLLIGWTLFVTLYLYYFIFCFWYRVELNDRELILKRFLIPTRRIAWQEIVSFTVSPDWDTVTFTTEAGYKVAIYTSLNGLSAVRRCLGAYALFTKTETSWTTTDPVLVQCVPAWRCDDMDFEDDPFAPLGSWREVTYEK